MGNCMRRESAVWAGDDWSSTTAEDDDEPANKSGSSWSSTCHASGGRREQVKIKMTKKELEELVATADSSGLSIEQVLATFIHHHYHVEDHHNSWRPTLQTIPELD